MNSTTRRAAAIGAILAVSLLLASCQGCDANDGIVSVAVDDGALVAFEVADDFEAGEELVRGYTSRDLGHTWSELPEAETPRVDELPNGVLPPIQRPLDPVEWCSGTTCYRIDGLELSQDGTTRWEPPTGRAEFVGRAEWEPNPGFGGCIPDRNTPMALTAIDGGDIGGDDVVLVGAGVDGVLVATESDVRRLGVGDWSPREYRLAFSGLTDSELLVLAFVALVSMLGTGLALERSGGVTASPLTRRRPHWALRVIGWLVVGVVAVAGALFLLLASMSFWLPAMYTITLLALLAGRSGVTRSSVTARGWLLGAVWLPFVVGWLPLVGWTMGTPARLSVAVGFATAGAVLAGAALVVAAWVANRHESAPAVHV